MVNKLETDGYWISNDVINYFMNRIATRIYDEGTELITDYTTEMNRHSLTPSVSSLDSFAISTTYNPGDTINTTEWNTYITKLNNNYQKILDIISDLQSVARDHHLFKLGTDCYTRSYYYTSPLEISEDASSETTMSDTAVKGVFYKTSATMYNIIYARKLLNKLESDHGVSQTNFNTIKLFSSAPGYATGYSNGRKLPHFNPSNRMFEKANINDYYYSFSYYGNDDKWYFGYYKYDGTFKLTSLDLGNPTYSEIFGDTGATEYSTPYYVVLPPSVDNDGYMYVPVMYSSASNSQYPSETTRNTIDSVIIVYKYNSYNQIVETQTSNIYSYNYMSSDDFDSGFTNYTTKISNYNNKYIFPAYASGDNGGDDVYIISTIKYDYSTNTLYIGTDRYQHSDVSVPHIYILANINYARIIQWIRKGSSSGAIYFKNIKWDLSNLTSSTDFDKNASYDHSHKSTYYLENSYSLYFHTQYATGSTSKYMSYIFTPEDYFRLESGYYHTFPRNTYTLLNEDIYYLSDLNEPADTFHKYWLIRATSSGDIDVLVNSSTETNSCDYYNGGIFPFSVGNSLKIYNDTYVWIDTSNKMLRTSNDYYYYNRISITGNGDYLEVYPLHEYQGLPKIHIYIVDRTTGKQYLFDKYTLPYFKLTNGNQYDIEVRYYGNGSFVDTTLLKSYYV